jgi:iron-sulfur cluster assembly protein
MEDNLDDVIASLIDWEDGESEAANPGSVHGIDPVSGHGVDSATDPASDPMPGHASEPVILLTERAAREIRRIRAAESLSDDLLLRVAVEGGGCSGLSYKLGFDPAADEDIRCESQGLSIVVDPRHAIYLTRCEIDYPDGLNARGFVFNNPNASESCGCGSSFAV